MSNEAQIRTSLRIRLGKLNYQSQPTVFLADVSTAKGPSPGAISVTVGGVDVDLSQLAQPGLCRLMNLDSTNFVTVGVKDPETDKFYPLLELLPGESYVVRLSRDVNQEYSSTGTGTTDPGTNALCIRSDADDCNVLVEAFDA
jgi:hypothetical protein